MKKIVIVTDLGTFKAYGLDEDRGSSRARLEPLEGYETTLGDDRISRWLSDQAGDFGKGSKNSAAIGDGASGERHGIPGENHRRSVAMIAGRIAELLKDGEIEGIYLAAANEINNEIIEALPAEARAKIERNVHANLVNARRDEVLERFAGD